MNVSPFPFNNKVHLSLFIELDFLGAKVVWAKIKINVWYAFWF